MKVWYNETARLKNLFDLAENIFWRTALIGCLAMTNKLKKIAIAVLLLFLSISFFAYGEATVEKMVDSCIWLSSPSLKGFLGVYKKEVIKGVNEVLETDFNSSTELICQKLQNEFEEMPLLASRQPSFEVIANKFGRIAGYVFLLNDPLRESKDERSAEIKQDYKKYIDLKISKLILTFDGYDNPPLENPFCKYFEKRQGDFQRYIDSILFCYFPEGKKVSSKTFDDRSNAFGAAQRILSRSVSDAAKVWLEVWKKMDGDTKGTPFLDKKGKQK
ncbi:MAG: hypothetical protein N2445_07185 [Acidobacteria bacterium]|nr:hypothetical protein [Acidobacteriota bacterium]